MCVCAIWSKAIETSTIWKIYRIFCAWCMVYYIIVNLVENYWKIKDPENGNGSTKVSFPFGTRSRIIDKRNWTCMNFGWIRTFHPLFALNPTWPCYVVNWGVHPKILSRTIREITTHVGLYVCYVLSTYVCLLWCA